MFGKVQKDIIAFLTRHGQDGAYIGCNTTAPELRGYDLEQVEAATSRLLGRGVIRREGIRYILVGAPGTNNKP